MNTSYEKNKSLKDIETKLHSLYLEYKRLYSTNEDPKTLDNLIYLKINTYHLITIYFLVNLLRLIRSPLQLVSEPSYLNNTEVAYMFKFRLDLLEIIYID